MGSNIALPALDIHPPAQQNPADLISQMMRMRQQQALMPGQLQLQQQQVEAGGQENQLRAQQIKNVQAGTAAMQEWDGKDINELPGLYLKHGADANAIMQLKSGIIKQQQDLANLNKDQLANEKTKNDYFTQAIDNVKQLPPDQQPAAFKLAVSDAVQKGHLDPQQAQGLQYQNPQQLDILEKTLMGHSQVVDQALKDQQTKEAAAKTSEANANAEKTGMEVNAMKQFGGMSPQMAESRYLSVQSKLNQKIPVSPDDLAFKAAYEKNKTLVPTANINLQAGLLSDEAKQMAAQYYGQTGNLPTGMRSPAMSAGIMNTAAAAPGGAPNVAANKASFAANEKSLESLQKNYDQVTAFENTAGKNLDTFLATAKKAVDFGSPWVNRPLRSLSSNMMGSEDQAAFNAARTTAVTEIAKVLNSSNASGVLSDSARKEVQDLIGPDATLKQIYSAANILKQDMGNRRQAYQDQISEIKQRAGGGNQPPASQPLQNQGGGVSVKAPNGKTYTFKDQASADAFKKNANIQ